MCERGTIWKGLMGVREILRVDEVLVCVPEINIALAVAVAAGYFIAFYDLLKCHFPLQDRDRERAYILQKLLLYKAEIIQFILRLAKGVVGIAPLPSCPVTVEEGPLCAARLNKFPRIE